jgi:hypothetical protein
MSSDLQWGSRRRTLAWTNFVLQALLLATALLFLNLIARKFPARYDLTTARTYAVSSIAEDLLRGLTYDVEIWLNPEVFDMGGDKAMPAAVARTAELLEEFRRRSARIKVYALGAASPPRAEVFQQHFPLPTPSALFLLADLGGGRVNKQTLEIAQFFESNRATGEIVSFRGEPLLVHAIRELGGSTKRIVYETEGHQEIVTADVRQLGVLANFMKVNEGIEFRRLPLADYSTVPVDADAVMILGPSQPFLAQERELIREYLERGGRLLYAGRPRVKSGLEELLESYGARIGENLVCDRRGSQPGSITSLIIRDFNVHEINRSLVNASVVVPECSTVDPVEKKDPKWRVTPLAMSGPAAWEEKGDLGPGARSPGPDGDERVGGLKLAVAVEKPSPKPQNPDRPNTRLVVWGSAGVFTNNALNPSRSMQLAQLQYVVNHFRWLMEREPFDLQVRKVSVKPLELSEAAFTQLRWVVLAGFPSFGILLGVVVWFLRRK